MTDHPTARLLVIDDEIQIRRLLHLTLEGAGYTVIDAPTGREGLEEAVRAQPDAIVLDMGLPDLSGIEVLQHLRGWSRMPVLVLTVKSAEDDKVAALDAGADDYLTKPFSAPELCARIRALLRRAPTGGESSVIAFGDIVIDLAARTVKLAGTPVKLTPKEFAFLRLLAINRGRVLTHTQILRELWGPKAGEHTHYLRVHMTHLRQKLEYDPHRPRHLRTESGIGYRLVEE